MRAKNNLAKCRWCAIWPWHPGSTASGYAGQAPRPLVHLAAKLASSAGSNRAAASWSTAVMGFWNRAADGYSQ